MLSTCLTSCEVEPAPKIKEGRFNFSVTYEEWGKAKTVSGVFVCEYAGRSFTLEGGDFTREWEGSVEGVENLHDTFYATVRVGETNDGGEIFISLLMYPEYFMGDPEHAESTPIVRAEIFYDDRQIDDADVIAEYGVKLIDCKYDKPIENTYK